MKLHSVIACPLGVSSYKGSEFDKNGRNIILPTSSIRGEESLRFFDIRTMINDPCKRIYRAFFNKRIPAFVRDKHEDENHNRLLVVLVSYGRTISTMDDLKVVFTRTYLPTRKLPITHIWILSFLKSDGFDFDLITEDSEDERNSFLLKYNSTTEAVEVIDWAEEDLRRKDIPETTLQWFWRQVIKPFMPLR